MKKGISRLVALALVLMLTLSMSALAAETSSDPFRVDGAKPRPEEQVEQPAEPEGEPQQDAEPTEEPEAEPSDEPADEPTAEPTEEPEAEPSEEPTAEPTDEPEAEPAPSEEPAEPEQPEVDDVVGSKVIRTGRPNGTVNLRAGAGMDSAILATLHEGDVVNVLADEGSWTKVRTAGGTEGYVAAKYLADAEPVATPEPTEEPVEEPEILPETLRDVIVVLSEGEESLPLYAEPSEDSEVLAQLANGELLSAAEIGEKWTLVVYGEQKGYVRTEKIALYNMVEPAPEEEQPEIIRSITVVSSLAGATEVYEGTPVTLSATLNGFEGVEYRMQWQASADGGATVVDIPGATGAEYSFNITEENASFLWRLSVTILAEQQ